MRGEAIRREAGANLRGGTTRAGLFALLLALVMTVAAGADALQIRQLTRAAQTFMSSGASISVLHAEGNVDGQACQALGKVEGIRAAGALRISDNSEIVLALLPSAPVPVAEVTPGFERLLGADSQGKDGLVLAREAAEPLGLFGAGAVALRDGTSAEVAAVYEYPSDGRAPGYGYLALAPTASAAPFDECWIDVFPSSDTRVSLLYTALDASGAGAGDEENKPSIGQLNTRLGTSFNGSAMLESRITRFLPALALLAGIGLGFVAIRRRRLELASHLHAGVTRADLRAILALETAAWVSAGSLAAATFVVLLVSADSTSDMFPSLAIAARAIYSGAVGALAGAGVAWWRTREEHLFRYFKER